MKSKFSLSRGKFPTRIIALLAVLLASIGQLQAETFGRIVSLGDSLADTGNVYALSGLPPFPYYEGRFSNGMVWTEYLAEDLGVELVTYAFGGAYTDDTNLFDFRSAPGLPGLTDQVMIYLYMNGGTIPESDLITIVAGSNDFFGLFEGYTGLPVPAAAQNTLGNVETLIQNGAEHLVVLGIPDLSSVPEFTPYPEEIRKQLKELVKSHNLILKKGLYDLRKAYGVDIVFINTFEEINTIIEHPADYGLTDVVTPGLYLFPSPVDTYLFWDTVHPTTKGHSLIADAVMDSLIEHYSE